MFFHKQAALKGFGATPADLAAVILTHGHFDHVGIAERLRQDHRVGIRIHEADRELARHPYRYKPEAVRWTYPFRYPRGLPVLAQMTAAGALWVDGVSAENGVEPGVALDVPGNPIPVWSPGHTDGHCGFLLAQSGILFTGDALVTLDPYTGRLGPRMVARAATADVAANASSLDRFAATEAQLALPGHGAPYIEGIRKAVAEAHRAGAA